MTAVVWTISIIAIAVTLVIAYRWERPRDSDDDPSHAGTGPHAPRGEEHGRGG